MSLTRRCLFAIAWLFAPLAWAADWPQFMFDAAHSGDAGAETLRLPLGLAAKIQLDDAVLTAPAIVGGRAYVVDQMGTAYGLDPQAGRILWRAAPDGEAACGANTSSPCVVGGRVVYGTTAGNLHVLDARDGSVVRSVAVGSPILSSPVAANEAIYFQALDAVLRCLDHDGRERWRWDHYARYQEPPEITKATASERGHPGSYDLPHYGGGDVAVSGRRVVTSFGWDLVCVEDTGPEPRLAWCNRAPNGRDGASPMSPSIAGDWVYVSGMGADGHLALTRLGLADGRRERSPGGHREAHPWMTSAVRGDAAIVRESHDGKSGLLLFDFARRQSLASWRDEREATPFAGSTVLTKNQLVATTLRGELIVSELGAKPAAAFRLATPHGMGIGSTPAVVDGRVYFGADDGCFYVLGSDSPSPPPADVATGFAIPSRSPRTPPAPARRYTWPSVYGNGRNTSFIDDPDLRPPFRVRWASRGFGHFLTPCLATEDDVISVSFRGLVTCQEQATGRIRWRRQLPGPEWGTASGLLAADGKLFVPRPTFGRHDGEFYCLDLSTGRTRWSAKTGGRYIWERGSPVAAAGRVVFGSSQPGTPPGTLIQAWDADTGQPAWSVELNVAGNRSGSVSGCTDGQTLYFTAGAGQWQWKQEGDKQRGESVAIDAATGRVLWRRSDIFGASYPVLTDERFSVPAAEPRLLLNGDSLFCVSPRDGTPIWKRPASGFTRFSIGADYIAMRGYGGHGMKLRLSDGVEDRQCKQLGGPTHACSSVTLTPRLSLASTVGGLQVRDVTTGELLWSSPGFAPRGCVNPILANGRVFWPSAASGTNFCWEPAGGP